MKRILKTLLCLSICAVLVFSVFSFGASAAGTIIAFSKKSVTVGENLTVTVTLNAEEPMVAVSCIVNYDASKFEYSSGSATGGAGSLKIIESPSQESKVSYSLNFKAIASGSCTFSAVDCNYCTVTEDKTLSGASATATVNDASLSSNCNLSALSLSSGKLSPGFSSSRTTYNVTVPNSVTDISVFATAADPSASVNAPAKTALKLGKNVLSVVVTAASGAQKTYTVNVTRSETEETEVPESTEPAAGSLDTEIGGVINTVAADISGIKLFPGFVITQTNFKGNDISIATDPDGIYSLYYLKPADSDVYVPYTYDSETDTFTVLPYTTNGDNYYIFSTYPEDKDYGENYYPTTAKLCGFDVECLLSNDKNSEDFYYVYCFANGSYGVYRYDSKENSIQRFPELVLKDFAVVDKEEKDNLLTRFSVLTFNSKLIVISALVVILGLIALLVLLIVKIAGGKKDELDDDDFDGDFSSISISTAGDEPKFDFSTETDKNVWDNQNDDTTVNDD